MAMTTPGAGDRQPGESDRAFAAFRIYVDLGAGRSTARVGERLGHRSSKQSEKWSARWRWVERARQIDSADARVVDAGRREELHRIAERQANEARLHMAATVVVARALLTRVAEDPGYLGRLDVDQLARLEATMGRTFARLVPVERLALGMTTEQPAEPTPRDVAEAQAARMSDDELRATLAPVDELSVYRKRPDRAVRDRPATRRADPEAPARVSAADRRRQLAPGRASLDELRHQINTHPKEDTAP